MSTTSRRSVFLLGAFLLVSSILECRPASDVGRAAASEIISLEHRDLLRTLAARRIVEPLLVGRAPVSCPPERASAGPRRDCAGLPEPGEDGFAELADIGTRIRRAVRADRSASNVHAAGVWNLLWSSRVRGSSQLAVERLAEAAALAPENAHILSDLAAAHLVRAGIEDEPLDLIRALELLDRAMETPAARLAIAFNRLYALDRLQLGQALRSERDRSGLTGSTDAEDLAAPPDPGQTAAAAKRPTRDQLLTTALAPDGASPDGADLRRLVAGAPTPSHRLVLEELLPEWAAAMREADPERALARLRAAWRIARALATETAESQLLAAVALVGNTLDDQQTARAERLVRGHLAFREGLDGLGRSDCVVLAAAMKSAENDLAAAGSPIAAWARYYQFLCRYYVDPRGAEAAFRQLAGSPGTAGSPRLQAESERMIGLCATVQGRHEAGTGNYRRALRTLREARFHDGLDALRLLLTEALEITGQTAAAWHERLAVLTSTRDATGSPLRHNVLFEAARSLRLHDHARAALRFADEMVANADASSVPGLAADARRSRAEILAHLGRPGEARDALAEARTLAAAMAPGPLRQRLAADLEVAWGGSLASTAPAEAIGHLTTALTAYRGSGHLEQTTRLLLDRARALRALGRPEEALADLEAAIDEVERRRVETRDEQLRIGYFETVQAVFDEAVDLLLIDLDRPLQALVTAERMRSRALLDKLAPTGPAAPFDPDALASALPAATRLIEYAVLPKRLVLWIVRSSGISTISSDISRHELEDRVDRLRTLIEGGAAKAAIRSQAKTLYELLLAPAEKDAAEVTGLILVPDRALFRLPFAALLDPSSDRFAVERFNLSVAPSASILLSSAGRAPLAERRAPDTVLLVGNPSFDRLAFPRLGPLPGAEHEVAALAGLYPAAKLLVGVQATPERLSTELLRSRIAHIAAHALVNIDNPESSRILAATGETGGDGLLRAKEIAALDLADLDLVYLSTCRNVDTLPARAREGLSGIARSFLGAGASAVVANLWQADDRTAAGFAQTFHRQLFVRWDPAAALAAAQAATLNDNRSIQARPVQWAGYQLLVTRPTTRR